MMNDLIIYYYLLKLVDYVKVEKNYDELKEKLPICLSNLHNTEYSLDRLAATYLIDHLPKSSNKNSKFLINYCRNYLNEGAY